MINISRLIIASVFLALCLATAQAHPGIGIVKDSKGNVFYTDLTHVWKISPDGRRSIAVKNVHTHELYVDEQDDLYGEHEYYKGESTDTWGNYVWCLSSDGVFEITIPEVDGFLDNNTLVRDSDGSSYWINRSEDHQMLNRYSLNGKNTRLTEHVFEDVRWMHYSKIDESVYVVDNLKVKKVMPTGKVVVISDGLKETRPPFDGVADRHYIFGIWTSMKNDTYVAVFGAGKVKRIDSTGRVVTVFESESGWSPCGGMTDSDGTLWVMEFSVDNKTRIRKINSNGKQTVYGG